MDAFEAILSRRSIRKYTSEPVSEEQVKKLMECAMAAPSAGNQQPWQFIVVDDRATLDAITTIQTHTLMLKEAPMAVIVCGDPSTAKIPTMWTMDCAAATQNILLSAYAQGLGTCWCAAYPNENTQAGLRNLLGLPETLAPFSIIAVGHGAEQKPPANRYNEARVHRDKW
ncbi:MAG: nitroreductase family protein [Bacillota bacterium]